MAKRYILNLGFAIDVPGREREHKGVRASNERAQGSTEGANTLDGTSLSGAKRRGLSQQAVTWVRGNYIYIIYTPNLGLRIAVSVREKEQGRFKGITEGARGSKGEQEGASRKH